MSNPHRTVVGYYSRTLESLLGDECQQMKTINDLQPGTLAFQLKSCAFEPLISRLSLSSTVYVFLFGIILPRQLKNQSAILRAIGRWI